MTRGMWWNNFQACADSFIISSCMMPRPRVFIWCTCSCPIRRLVTSWYCIGLRCDCYTPIGIWVFWLLSRRTDETFACICWSGIETNSSCWEERKRGLLMTCLSVTLACIYLINHKTNCILLLCHCEYYLCSRSSLQQ